MVGSAGVGLAEASGVAGGALIGGRWVSRRAGSSGAVWGQLVLVKDHCYSHVWHPHLVGHLSKTLNDITGPSPMLL